MRPYWFLDCNNFPHAYWWNGLKEIVRSIYILVLKQKLGKKKVKQQN